MSEMKRFRSLKSAVKGRGEGKPLGLFPAHGQLPRFLAGEVLDVEAQHVHAGEALVQLALQRLLCARVEALAQNAGGGELFLRILNDADAPEGDNTAENGREISRSDIVAMDDAERCFVA